MIKFFHNNQGYSLVELLVATALTAIIIAAIYAPLTGATRIFRDVKSVSDNVQGKSPTVALIEKYFDRWGKGVATEDEWQDCPDCPEQSRHYLNIGSDNGCSTVEFYGNIYGIGFVLENADANQPANLIDCRLNQDAHRDKTILWRDGDFVDQLDTNLNITPTSSPPTECIDPGFPALTGGNAVITAPNDQPLRAGDIIQRAPFKIKFSCYTPSFAPGQTWVRVQEKDTLGKSDEEDDGRTYHIAPVDNSSGPGFSAQALPPNCDPAAGECTAVEITLILLSETTKHDGETRDTYTVTRIFGR